MWKCIFTFKDQERAKADYKTKHNNIISHRRQKEKEKTRKPENNLNSSSEIRGFFYWIKQREPKETKEKRRKKRWSKRIKKNCSLKYCLFFYWKDIEKDE